jgi:hypothetical protein
VHIRTASICQRAEHGAGPDQASAHSPGSSRLPHSASRKGNSSHPPQWNKHLRPEWPGWPAERAASLTEFPQKIAAASNATWADSKSEHGTDAALAPNQWTSFASLASRSRDRGSCAFLIAPIALLAGFADAKRQRTEIASPIRSRPSRISFQDSGSRAGWLCDCLIWAHGPRGKG